MTGMEGTLIVKPGQDGKAVFTDLRVYVSGKVELRFISDGMVSVGFPLTILPDEPSKFALLREPPANSVGGRVLSTMTNLALTDQYTNTIVNSAD